MNIVDKAIKSPMHCAVYPHLGSAQPEGYFDTQTVLPGPGIHEHSIYVSVVAVKELARKLGWVSPEEVATIRENVAVLVSELADANAKLEDAQASLAAIDVIESEGFRARKKPGRKIEKAPA